LTNQTKQKRSASAGVNTLFSLGSCIQGWSHSLAPSGG
jgi:hypothetical protein